MRNGSKIGILLVLAVLALASEGWAASYQKIDGTIVDPILDRLGNAHWYTGPNLEPGISSPQLAVYLTNANLSQADLRSADLPQSNIEDADLSGSNLSGANFSDARFDRSTLSYANLQSTSLFRSSLSFADLSNAILDGADLSRASLWMANLSGASLVGAYYDGNTAFPSGFDPIAAGMISGSTVVNNGLAPPAPTNVFHNPERDLIINNVGCNASIERPCLSPGASTEVSGLVQFVSVYETSSFLGSAQGVILHDSSTGDFEIFCDFGCSASARDSSSATVQAQAYEAGVHSSGDAFVYATGGAWENVSASGNSHMIVVGGEAQGSNFSVSDNALLEIYVDEPWGIYVSGGRAILHRGSSHVGTAVERGGVLEVSGGWLESDRSDQPVSVTGNRISGEMFMSSGGIGPGDFRVDGYAQINDGVIIAAATPEYSVPGPWNFSTYDDGLIELLGGAMNEFVSIGARDDSRIRLFGHDFAVSGHSLPYGMVDALSGTLSGTLASGAPIANEFAHRGADCGGQPCTGRILVLAPGLDWDQDTIPNVFDNCAEEPNADQADFDSDGTGDVCFAPVDLDRDGIVDALDNCRVDANPDQLDTDADGVGDACEKGLLFWADKGLEGCTTPPQRLPYELVSNDLGNGDVIDRSAQPCDCFGIEYPVTPGTASVRFLHRTESGFVEEYCENVAPYALGLGPNQPICADGLDEDGLHEVMATPYDAPGCEAGGGNALPSSIRSFTMAAPEPGLASLIGAGVLGLSGLARRRSRRSLSRSILGRA